jgi:hypothetical protein
MKINSTIYKKLVAQAEEAKEQGLTVLANAILNVIGSCPDEEKSEYTYAQMKEDLHQDLWKMATRLMYYYDLDSADAVKLDRNLTTFANQVLDNLEIALGVDSQITSPREPKLPGEQ